MKKSELLIELAKIEGYSMACDQIEDDDKNGYCEQMMQMIRDLIDNARYPIIEDLMDTTR